jgi:Tfp pilus assembly protein PilO
MTLSYREKILVILMLVVAIIYVGSQFLVMPAYNSYTKNQASLLTVTGKKIQAQNYVLLAANINSSLIKTQKDAIDTAKPFLPSLDSVSLNVWATNNATNNGFTIQSIAITDPKVTTIQLAPAKVASTAQASYPINDFANVVNGINNQAPITTPPKVPAANGKLDNNSVLESDISLSMTGQFSKVSAFLDAIKSSNRTAVVSSFTTSINDKGVFTLTCTINCFSVQKLDSSDKLVDINLPTPSGKNIM